MLVKVYFDSGLGILLSVNVKMCGVCVKYVTFRLIFLSVEVCSILSIPVTVLLCMFYGFE